jgi:hypothetical protein
MRRKLNLGLILFISIMAPLASHAQSVFPDCGMLGLSCQPISVIVINFTKWLLGIFGFIAIIAFTISGIQYLVSAGDEKMQERAKRTMYYAIIGVIVGLAGLTIIYAIQKVLGGSTTQF